MVDARRVQPVEEPVQVGPGADGETDPVEARQRPRASRVLAQGQPQVGVPVVQRDPAQGRLLAELVLGDEPNTRSYQSRLRATSTTGSFTWCSPHGTPTPQSCCTATRASTTARA